MNTNPQLYKLTSISLQQYPSKKPALIVPLSNPEVVPELTTQITTICRSEPNYSVLFKDLPFIASQEGSDPKYIREDAEFWVSSFVEAWENRDQNVVYLIVAEETVVGAIEVRQKSAVEAELGYWSNPKQTGYMTNALKVFVDSLKEIGFQNIYAFTKLANTQSRLLLERLGGIKDNLEKKNFQKYIL